MQIGILCLEVELGERGDGQVLDEGGVGVFEHVFDQVYFVLEVDLLML